MDFCSVFSDFSLFLKIKDQLNWEIRIRKSCFFLSLRSPYLNKEIRLPGTAESMGKMMRANTIMESNRRDENFSVAITLVLVNARKK